MLSLETLRAAPKVLMHDHLDGGLRPATIVELARDLKYGGLPTTDPGELARWFPASAARGSPALRLRGFDIAGEEAGHPPKAHLEAFQLCRRENFSITIHAGEAFGPPSIWQALQYCGAHRIGHGVRLIEDMAVVDETVVKLGPLAAYVRDKRIPLELCPSSNVDTGAVPSLDEHPIRQFMEQRFRVTVNTDNRLMSDVTLSEEFRRLSRVFSLTLDDVEKLTLNAMKSAFIGYDERLAHIYGKIKPGFAKLRGEPALAGYRLPPSA